MIIYIPCETSELVGSRIHLKGWDLIGLTFPRGEQEDPSGIWLKTNFC